VLIIEDSPYKEIRFEGEHQTSFYALDGSGQVLNLGTFSKIFVPGFRIGWMIGHPDIIDKFVIAKQSTDLCTSPFVQKLQPNILKKAILVRISRKQFRITKRKRGDDKSF